MSWLQAHSQGIVGDGAVYTVGKYQIRKSWALVRHTPGLTEPVAYFRSEDMARQFCAELGLKLTDYMEDK